MTVDAHRAARHVVEARQQPRRGRLAAAGATDDRDRLARPEVQVEVVEHRRAVGVLERHVVEVHVAAALDEVDRARAIDHVGLLVEHLVDALRRRRRALTHHQDHAELAERRLQHQHVGVERDDVADRRLPVDGEVPAVEEHDRLAEAGQVLEQRRPLGPDVGVLHVRPLGAHRRAGQVLQLLVLGRERLHHAHAVDVLVDDGGDVGEARLDEPRHREHLLPHAHADDVDERHRRHRDQRERHVDREHLREREDRDAALHEDRRREREVHLHRADVGVRTRDELARLHAVVERERHAAQVLVHDVPQVVLDAVRRLEQVVARQVREHEADHREHHDDADEVLERRGRSSSPASRSPDRPRWGSAPAPRGR